MSAPPHLKKPIHVLFLCKWFPYYDDPQFGIFAYKHAVAASLFCNVSALFVRSSSKFSSVYSYEVREDKILTVNAYYKKSKFSILNLIRYLKAGLAGYRIITKKAGKPTLLNFYILVRPAIIGVLISFFHKTPFIVTEQWSGYVTGGFKKKNVFKKLFTSFIITKAKAVIVVSKTLKKAMLEFDLKNHYFVIPNVVESISVTKKGANSNNDISLLMVADLVDEIKNVSGVLKALNLLKKQGQKFSFHIIGGGPDLIKLQKLAEEMNLIENTYFLGKQPNNVVYREMEKADVIIVNSNIETFSVICVEAMVNGKPVIATRCGGPEEIVTEETGILIEKNNPEALKEAILFIRSKLHEFNPTRMNELALKKYNYNVVGMKLMEVFDFALMPESLKHETF